MLKVWFQIPDSKFQEYRWSGLNLELETWNLKLFILSVIRIFSVFPEKMFVK